MSTAPGPCEVCPRARRDPGAPALRLIPTGPTLPAIPLLRPRWRPCRCETELAELPPVVQAATLLRIGVASVVSAVDLGKPTSVFISLQAESQPSAPQSPAVCLTTPAHMALNFPDNFPGNS